MGFQREHVVHGKCSPGNRAWRSPQWVRTPSGAPVSAAHIDMLSEIGNVDVTSH